MAQAASWLREVEAARQLYLVHLLCRHLALRNDEVTNGQVEWLVKRKREVLLRDEEKREIAGVQGGVPASVLDAEAERG